MGRADCRSIAPSMPRPGIANFARATRAADNCNQLAERLEQRLSWPHPGRIQPAVQRAYRWAWNRKIDTLGIPAVGALRPTAQRIRRRRLAELSGAAES